MQEVVQVCLCRPQHVALRRDAEAQLVDLPLLLITLGNTDLVEALAAKQLAQALERGLVKAGLEVPVADAMAVVGVDATPGPPHTMRIRALDAKHASLVVLRA